ncbi:hypothetical protein IA57_10095 [Mangrovimonas yunxiaonensis]|uniref:Lipoprotein n=1 Tax=Mangrovimonas yunxiaonensis TaxID=1197477 RepID=A0A084TJA8_9FLAO|nr:hypothetical protein [Mangrovimonas yunxiaonensis]KFB00794.1 hypothetical protein IA57_10095 [Mangrovimonas yunxiaonensis]GGH45680.1 hypothetical protein GCM10011364_19260 [Mangrovimonas yunxiaonensis]
MKYFKTFIVLCLCLTSFFSCKDEAKTAAPKEESTKTTATTPSKPKQTNTTENKNIVYHYTCDKGCNSGSNSAGMCSVCGSILTHNPAYHNTQKAAPTNTSSSPFATPTNTPSGQNAAGLWHYTCSNGCSGGSGSAGNCSSCGNALAHNAAYHQ